MHKHAQQRSRLGFVNKEELGNQQGWRDARSGEKILQDLHWATF